LSLFVGVCTLYSLQEFNSIFFISQLLIDSSSSKNEYATISAKYVAFITFSYSSSTSDNPALQRLNQLQRNEKKTWKGIRAECTGRPGTCTLLNNKRFFPVSELQKENDSQNKIFVSIFNKLAELENKKKIKNSENSKNGGMSPMSTSTNTSANSNAFNVNNSYGNKNSSNKANTSKPYQDFLVFKTIKEHQVVSGPLSTHLYTRGANDYSELTYKLLK
jgi:hypothetical protein